MKRCVICGRELTQRHRYKVRTCGRRCGGLLKSETWAAERLSRLTKQGLHTMTVLQGFRWGYKSGYQRRRDHEKKQVA